MNLTQAQLNERLATLPRRASDLVWQWEARTPSAAAIIDGDIRWSYGELAEAVREGKRLLQELSIRPGDRVLVINENGRAVIALLLATFALDAWAVIVNARLSAREIDLIAEHCGARRLLFTSGMSSEAAAHAERHQAAIVATSFGEIQVGPLNEATLPEPVDPSSAQVAGLLYTSGTTGVPKGVMLSHRNLLFVAAISGGIRGFVPDDIIYGVLPLAHAFGLASVFLGCLYAGACFMPTARFTPQQLMRDIEKGVTALQGVPAMYAKLLAHVRETGMQAPTHRLRFISAGGSPLDPAIKGRTEALFGLCLHNGYGMTETAPSLAMTRIDRPRHDSSVGQPLPFVEIKIVGNSGEKLPTGEAGHVWCRGPGVMKGYYRAPELTAQMITSDGWLVTGDLGKFDQDGSLHIVGRSKELIIRSGFNVYPPEVEAVLNDHPKVTQVAVIGTPEKDGEEEILAYVQVTPSDPPTIEELKQFCGTKLAPYKRPSRFVLCETLPAGPTGKILKHRLTDLAVPLAGQQACEEIDTAAGDREGHKRVALDPRVRGDE